MLKLKNLSGKDVIKILASFDFSIFAQKDNHIKMRRIVENGFK